MDHKGTQNQLFSIVQTVDTKISPFFTEKLPALPENIREVLAKIAPYLTILGVVLGAFGILAILGMIGVASPAVVMYGGTGATQAITGGIIGAVFLGIQILLQALAIPGLLKRQKNGWLFLFAASLVGLVFDLVSLNVFNLVVSFLISFYLLYQIKPYYKN